MNFHRSLATKMLLGGAVLYVSAVSLWANGGEGFGNFLLVVGGCVCGFLAIRTIALAPRRALSVWGLGLALASADAGGHRIVFAIAGAAVASTIGVRSVMAAPGLAGLGKPMRGPLPIDRLLIASWIFALVPAVRDMLRLSFGWPLPTMQASGLALGIAYFSYAIATLDRVRRAPVELGAHVRAFGALIAIAGAGIVGIFVAFGNKDARYAPLEIALAAASILAVHVSVHADPLRTVKRARRALAIVIFGGPIAFLAAEVAEGSRVDARAAILVAAFVVALAASYGKLLEEPLLPARGVWLRAIEKAEALLARKDGEDAIAAVLATMREASGLERPSPVLYLLHPARSLTVDSAGYLREHAGEAPSDLVELARLEPEAVLRRVALGPLWVRRPDLRPLATWMSDAEVDVCAVVTHEGEPEGVLALGFGKRTDAFTLEETVALKKLSDKLASVCAARAKTARGLLREQALQKQLEDKDDELARMEHAAAIEGGRHAATTTRLAEPVTLGLYSAKSRLAYDAVERRMSVSAPVVMQTPSGVDPVPYAARAHLTGPRKNKPFVVVEGTLAREHDLLRWTDPAISPFAIAHGGLLFFADGAAFPSDVQALVGRVLAERRAPWASAEALDIAIAFSSVHGRDALAEILEPGFVARLGDGLEQVIELPRLSERPEDLRAIVTDRLAREGLRARGAPVGIDDRAFAKLVGYSFPGEDAELRAIATRLVASLSGDVVRASDIEALGLALEPEDGTDDEASRGRIFLVK